MREKAKAKAKAKTEERKTEKIKAILVLTIILAALLTITSISLSLISAVGFSPTSLEFELLPGEEGCGSVSVTSDSDTISITDKWAENSSVEWKVSLFNTSSSELGLKMEYDKSLALNERNAEICVVGEKIGEYHGVLLLREEQEGNSIIQMGIWLKVEIVEKKTPPPEPIPAIVTNTGGGGGGGGTIKNLTQNITQNSSNNIINLNANNNADASEAKEDENAENSGITGAVIGAETGGSKLGAITIIIGIVLVLIVIVLFVYNNLNKHK